ncbi:MAG: Asp-tRNA(Asn)/Glu-tRNA(Gln) amidotransferase subunit GatC [Thermoanaerobaculia bacterium]
MKITVDEARRIAALAHLSMDDAALGKMAEEMTRILTFVDQLASADTTGVVDEAEAVTPMREDEPRPSLDRDLVARNAPDWVDGFFRVPKVIGE